MTSDYRKRIDAPRWSQLLAFSSPVFGFTGQEVAFKVFLPLYFSQIGRFSLSQIALLLLFFRVWDTLNDPMIGWLSDHWRWGHRRFVPMLIGTPVALGGATLILLAPSALSLVGMGVALFITALGWTLVNVPHGAWALEFSANPAGRTRVFGSRQLVGSMALPLFVLGPSVMAQLYGSNSYRDAIMFDVLMIVSLPLGLIWLSAKVPLTPQKSAPAHMALSGKIMIAAFISRQSLFLLALFACLGISAAVKDGLILFWVQYSLDLPAWGWSVVLLQSLLNAASVPLWVRLQARLGTMRALQASLGATALAATSVFFISPHSLLGLLGYVLINGSVTGSSFMLLRALLGDYFDEVTNRFGTNLAGTLYTGFHLAYNLAVAIAAPASLEILAMSGFHTQVPNVNTPYLGSPLVWVVGLGSSLPLMIALSLLSLKMRDQRNDDIRTFVF